MIKNISIRWKISGQLCFSWQAQIDQISCMIKLYIQYSEFRATLFFRSSASCSKILNNKKYFTTDKNFRANFVFRASASCSKVLNDKKYLNTVKIFRATVFFRASASWSNILLDKNIYSIQSAQGKLCFSGQAQVAQKSWTVKKFSIQCIQCIFTSG